MTGTCQLARLTLLYGHPLTWQEMDDVCGQFGVWQDC